MGKNGLDDTWPRAAAEAKRLMDILGVVENECSCIITPRKYGWRVVVTRYADAMVMSGRVVVANKR